MATPMEYDTLRETYSTAMAALTRFEMKHGIADEEFKQDENNFVKIWIEEVKEKKLKDIDYHDAMQKMNKASNPWILRNEGANSPKDL